MRAPKPQPWQDFSPRKRRVVNAIMRTMSRANVWLFQKTSGRLGSKFLEGTDVCLLTTTGRRSGEPRTVPLLYLRDGEEIILVASRGGDFKHPLWYLNLQATPEARVQIGAEVHECVARTASAQEKAEVWPRLVAFYSGFQDYQDIAERDIPVVFMSIVG